MMLGNTGAFLAAQRKPNYLRLGGGWYGMNGNIYCCRFHSRKLTAAEVAANYAVDKARFGLA